MKAKIVREELDCEPAHSPITRIVIEEKNNLAITPFGEEMFVRTGFEIDDNCTIIREIEIPDELIEAALEFVQAKEKFDKLNVLFKAYLG